MMLGVIFAQVSDSRLPVDEELALYFLVTYPIKAYVNRFWLFLFDVVVGEAISGGVFHLDWRGRLWLP